MSIINGCRLYLALILGGMLDEFKISPFIIIICSIIIGIGTSIGGYAVSTTHTINTAIMEVGAAKRLSAVRWSVVNEIVAARILTFPICGFIGLALIKA